jgi:hypothetical protein
LALSRGRRRGVRAGTLGITPSPGRASPVGEWIIKGAAARTPDPEGRHRRSAVRNPSAARPPAPPKPSACPLARMTERPVLVARRRMPSGAVVVPYPHDRGGRSRPGRCQGIGMSSHPGAQSQHPGEGQSELSQFRSPATQRARRPAHNGRTVSLRPANRELIPGSPCPASPTRSRTQRSGAAPRRPESIRLNRIDERRDGGNSGDVGAAAWWQHPLWRRHPRRPPRRCRHRARRRRLRR